MLILEAKVKSESITPVEVGSQWKVLAMNENKTLVVEEIGTERRINGVPCSVFGYMAEEVTIKILESEPVIMADVDFEFTVQAIASDFNVCEEWYDKEISDCIMWANDYLQKCADCEECDKTQAFKIIRTEGALTYLKGKVNGNNTVSWEEIKFPETEIPFVKPTWGIWDKLEVIKNGTEIPVRA